MAIQVTRAQAVAYRLHVNHLTSRLPSGSYPEAARFAIQDTIPRSALISLHARVEACEPTAWADERLVQTYSPRAAVHVVPATDLGIFTLGRMPDDPQERRGLEADADLVCRALTDEWTRVGRLPEPVQPRLRAVAATGRILIRWDARSLHVREIEPPAVDPVAARIELCRRHVHAFGPTTPVAFAWWAGISAADARRTWALIKADLDTVDVDGNRASILAADAAALQSARAEPGVRFLPGEELRIFGVDRTGTFVAPSRAATPPCYDTFHPHGLLIDGRLAGSWGRRQGAVDVRLAAGIPERARAAVEAEALAMPIPRATMTVRIA